MHMDTNEAIIVFATLVTRIFHMSSSDNAVLCKICFCYIVTWNRSFILIILCCIPIHNV